MLSNPYSQEFHDIRQLASIILIHSMWELLKVLKMLIKFSVTIANTWNSQFCKEKRFILAHGFEDFSQWKQINTWSAAMDL
jgi:hypothetical protein